MHAEQVLLFYFHLFTVPHALPALWRCCLSARAPRKRERRESELLRTERPSGAASHDAAAAQLRAGSGWPPSAAARWMDYPHIRFTSLMIVPPRQPAVAAIPRSPRQDLRTLPCGGGRWSESGWRLSGSAAGRLESLREVMVSTAPWELSPRRFAPLLFLGFRCSSAGSCFLGNFSTVSPVNYVHFCCFLLHAVSGPLCFPYLLRNMARKYLFIY